MQLNLTVAALAAGTSLLFAGTAAAEVTVTTGAGYVKMVQALVDAYQSQTQAKVGTAFGGNIGQMLAQVREGGKVNLVISDATSLQKFSNELKELKTGVKLGDTPLILAWRKGIVLTGPEDLDKSDVKRWPCPIRKQPSMAAPPKNIWQVAAWTRNSVIASTLLPPFRRS